jgi:hypothetical protein
LQFIKVKNGIEVLELREDLTEDSYILKDKRELLNLVRSKIKESV